MSLSQNVQEQKSILDNTVAQKDLQIKNLNDAISRLEKRRQQGSTQIQK